MPDGGLDGVRVALLEARMGSELGELVRRRGGIPTCVPAVREVAIDCTKAVASFIDAWENRPVGERNRVVIFLTGVGASALFREAELQGRLPALLQAMAPDVVVCRGPKPSAVVRRYGISPSPPVPEPYTSEALLETLHEVDLEARMVTLVHYGERSERLAAAITARGGLLAELCLYEWRLPDDVQPLAKMVQGLVRGEFDTLVFTSQIQCRHLFQIAGGMQLASSLVDALNNRVVVAAIGPTCQAAIEAFGVTPKIVPNPPKMGPLIISLATYFST
jgi:uroporphyrinogen-III synthase